MPNRHKLGVYLAPQHDNWESYLFAIDPGFIRILLPGDAPADLVSRVHRICPNADISLRWWDLDDGGEESKRRHLTSESTSYPGVMVNEYFARLWAMEDIARKNDLPFPKRSQIWFNTINEPEVNDPVFQRNVNRHCYDVMLTVDKIDPQVRVLYGEISAGNPNTWPPQWDWFRESLAYDGNHALALHEYWQPEGPYYEWTDHEGKERKDWGALAGRYQKLPFSVPIYITEAGVDGRIYNRHQTPDTGWRKFMDATHYTAQMRQYLTEVNKDSRIHTVLPFLTDYQDGEWWSFDTLPAEKEFDAMLTQMDSEVRPDAPPVTVRLPSVSKPGPIAQPAPMLGTVDPFVAMAVLNVESSGEDDLSDGLKIRFEAHIFKQYVSKNIFDAHFNYDPNDILTAHYRHSIHDPWLPIHRSQADENAALEIAKSINRDAAYKSISMGMAQIMGFNHARVGFATAEAMYKAMSSNQAYHLIAFFSYLFGDGELWAAVQNKDWRTIARKYNGSLFVDMYSARLEKEYNRILKENS